MKSRLRILESAFDTGDLESGEVSGTASVEVKFVDIRKNTSGEGGEPARYRR